MPDPVLAFGREDAARVDGREPWKLSDLDEPVKLLLASSRMEGWWKGLAGRMVAGDPAQLWRLADCIRIVRARERSALGNDEFAASVRWLTEPRAQRERRARDLARRARELSEKVRDTPFNRPANLLRLQAGARPPDEELRVDGPLAADVLSWLATAIELDAGRSSQRELPAFSDTIARAKRILIVFVYSFHESSLGIIGKDAHEPTLAVVGAALGQDVTVLEVQNALRALPPWRRDKHPFKNRGRKARK